MTTTARVRPRATPFRNHRVSAPSEKTPTPRLTYRGGWARGVSETSQIFPRARLTARLTTPRHGFRVRRDLTPPGSWTPRGRGASHPPYYVGVYVTGPLRRSDARIMPDGMRAVTSSPGDVQGWTHRPQKANGQEDENRPLGSAQSSRLRARGRR